MRQDNGISDDELVRRSREGSRDAMAIIYTRYAGRIMSYIHGMTLDHAVSEDMVHDTFVDFFQGMDRYEPRGRLAAYLFTIARRVVIARLRREAAAPSGGSPTEAALSVSPAGELEAVEMKERAAAALLRLPDKLREVVVLRIYNGMSYAEISEITGVGEPTLRSRLRYALDELRAAMKS